jgi:hypothetical protein
MSLPTRPLLHLPFLWWYSPDNQQASYLQLYTHLLTHCLHIYLMFQPNITDKSSIFKQVFQSRNFFSLALPAFPRASANSSQPAGRTTGSPAASQLPSPRQHAYDSPAPTSLSTVVPHDASARILWQPHPTTTLRHHRSYRRTSHGTADTNGGRSRDGQTSRDEAG